MIHPHHHPLVSTFPLVVVLIAALAATVTDFWRFRIPNALTFSLLLAGLLYQAIDPRGSGWVAGLVGSAFGLATLVVPYAMGGMGAGDVKLMAGVGSWLGLASTCQVFIVGALAAGVYSLILVALGRSFPELWRLLQRLWVEIVLVGRNPGMDGQLGQEMVKPGRRRRLIPFAAMIIVGVVSVGVRPWI